VADSLRPSFPNPVDEVSARLVAAGVVAQAALFAWVRSPILLAVLAYGFLARVLYGPRYSPLGLLVTRVVRPRLGSIAPRFVPGPPKRFAQGIGVVFSASALVAALAGATGVAVALIVGLLAAASLEAFGGVCLGCIAFRWLMRIGVIPASVCEACNDIRAHLAARAAQPG
jgi:hypothetical protein